MANPQQFMQQAIFASFRRAWADREPILLLAGIILCVNLILFAPVRNFQIQMMGTKPGELSNFLSEHESMLGEIVFITLIFTFFLSSAQAVLARLADERHPPIFEGGARLFILRTIQVYWRGLCAVGWLLVFLMPVGFVASAFGGGAALAIIYFAFLVISFPVLAALAYAISAAANDQAISIRDAFIVLGPHRMRFIGLTFILFVSAQILVGIVDAIAAGSGLYNAQPGTALALVIGANYVFLFFIFAVWLGVASRIRGSGTPSYDIEV